MSCTNVFGLFSHRDEIDSEKKPSQLIYLILLSVLLHRTASICRQLVRGRGRLRAGTGHQDGGQWSGRALPPRALARRLRGVCDQPETGQDAGDRVPGTCAARLAAVLVRRSLYGFVLWCLFFRISILDICPVSFLYHQEN